MYRLDFSVKIIPIFFTHRIETGGIEQARTLGCRLSLDLTSAALLTRKKEEKQPGHCDHF